MTLVVEKRKLEGNYDVLEYDELARVPLVRARRGGARTLERPLPVRRARPSTATGSRRRSAGSTVIFENNATPVYWTRERGAGGAGVVAEMPRDRAKRIRRYRQTVYAPYAVPAWAQDAVYYYIFPERFRNGDTRNDPKPGVDRFHDKTVEFHANWNDKPCTPELAATAATTSTATTSSAATSPASSRSWTTSGASAPTRCTSRRCSRAASNHKYDTADWKHIDPHFGSNADFARLCREAARRGIRVIPDASLNHTGADSIYFDRYGTRGGQGAFEGGKINPASPYASWYTFDTTQTDPDKQFKGWVGVRRPARAEQGRRRRTATSPTARPTR